MFTLNCRGKLVVARQPLIMGVINVTPDSFYPSSRFSGIDAVLAAAGRMIEEGADILDIGGQSTKPGIHPTSISEELNRVVEPIAAIHQRYPDMVLSIDTYRSAVAAEAMAAGASMINDIGAGNLDPDMMLISARFKAPYICMHMQGEPSTMQQNPAYDNVCLDVLDFFIEKKSQCRQAGIHDMIIDPGFGFGKTREHNFELLKNLSIFQMLQCPVLLGVSRKSTIYKTLGITPQEALNGTTVLHTIGLLQGANILRVHDVREAREAVKLMEAMA